MGERKKTRQILVGKVKMGGGAPVTIQSMLNTPAEDLRQASSRQSVWRRRAARSSARPSPICSRCR